MRKVRFGMGGILMIASMMISDSFAIIGVYLLAAAWHEAGHILTSKLMKIEIKEIKFGFSGIRIVTDSHLTSYKREFWLSLAGPCANILAFIITVSVFKASGMRTTELFESASRFLGGERGVWEALAFFALASLIQAIMNLLPVNTFDGGRMIYCAVAELFSQHAAERILSILSAFSAFILWTVALYLMLRISAGMGIFVFSGCIFALITMKDK